jgi:4-amino-4-deoxy-L-arabinose transferase-like glycosyltransferase
MNNAALHSTAISNSGFSRATVFKFFIGIASVAFILRIFYAGHLYQDDGLWFAAAEEILRGKALYREIFFDKPPALPLLYAGLFRVFGAHIIAIRLFTICYSVVISVILYAFGSRLYDKRTGLIAAVMFSVFSTTYISGDMQSLNTDFLMAPFYTAGAYLLIRSGTQMIRSRNVRDGAARLALAGGCMVGIAFQFNPKGAFDLVFFALFLIAACIWRIKEVESGWRADTTTDSARPLSGIKNVVRACKLFALAVAGFMLASLPFFLYVLATHSFSRYRLYVWDLSLRYTNYYPLSRAGGVFLRYGTDYFLINNTLLITLVVIVAVTIRQTWRCIRDVQPGNAGSVRLDQDSRFNGGAHSTLKADAALLIWFGVSFLGVATGGRFFAHYYFQALPSLCLIGGRGLVVINSSLRTHNRILRQIGIAVLITGFVYTLVRSHSETAGLAVDWVRGKKSEINREARIVAATVRDIPDPANTVDRFGAEGIREGGPRNRAANGPSDYLFVWGNLPEIYYWSGLLPASRYLGAQPLTGLPADVQYGKEEYHSLLDASLTAAARTELARDLEQTPPKYVVDELGFRDLRLSIERYAELHDFLSDYERYGSANSFPIYIRKP